MLLKDAIAQFDHTLERLANYITVMGVPSDANTDTLARMAEKVLEIGMETGAIIHVEDAESNAPLDGRFAITNAGTATHVNSGIAYSGVYLNTLTPGEYDVRIHKTNPGYVLCDRSQANFSVADKHVTHVYLAELKVKGILITPIEDITNAPLPGVVVEVYDAVGNKVYTGTTNEYGYAMTGTVPNGNYTVKLTEWPNKYSPKAKEAQVTVTGGDPVTTEFRFDELNSLIITLTDGNGTPLAGGVFTVQNAYGGPLFTLTTGPDGKATHFDKTGFYLVTQTVAPAGYTLGSKSQFAQITTAGPALINYTNTKA